MHFGKVARTFPCFSPQLQQAFSRLKSVLLFSRVMGFLRPSPPHLFQQLFVKRRRAYSIWRLDQTTKKNDTGRCSLSNLWRLVLCLSVPTVCLVVLTLHLSAPTGCQACCDLAFSDEVCHCCGSHLILYQQVFT